VRPQIPKPPLSGFFVARFVRAFLRLDYLMPKEIKLALIKAAITIAATVVCQLVKHFL
jgi:hypothetical protein